MLLKSFYDEHLAQASYMVGCQVTGEALVDRRVVRPVFFPRTGGEMEWSAPDGTEHSATFDDALDAARASQRLRTALSLDGEWLPSVLRDANSRLREVRQVQPDAGGLVIATGTPVGVGIGFKPPKYLKSGDVVRVEIDGIGFIENPVK